MDDFDAKAFCRKFSFWNFYVSRKEHSRAFIWIIQTKFNIDILGLLIYLKRYSFFYKMPWLTIGKEQGL